MGYPRLGGEGGRGGDVWLVARERTTLKSIRDRYPQKRFVAGPGANSRYESVSCKSFHTSFTDSKMSAEVTKPGLISPSVKALKGEKGKDCEVHVPLGISVLCDDGKQIGKNFCFVLMDLADTVVFIDSIWQTSSTRMF